MTQVAVKRAYEAPSPDDGFRILVDRIWPRGLKRDAAGIDVWLKDVAPSTDLRKWFGHDPAKWPEFACRYRAELAATGALDQLLDAVRQHRQATLVFAAHDAEHNNAVVLQNLCRSRLKDE